MLKRWKANTGYLLLAVSVLLLALPIMAGSLQPFSRVYQETTTSRETRNLSQSCDLLVMGFQTDDNYEPNDQREFAYDLTEYEQTWLSEIDGHGVQWDDDWYEIYVSSGNSHLNVELTFTDALGDIDIAVYDAYGSFVEDSTGVSDNEYIDVDVSVGTYYLKIYFGDDGNSYDLWWDDSVSGNTPPTTPFLPLFSPFLMFIIIAVVAGVIIVIVVVIVVVVVVRLATRSSRARPPIRRSRPSTRPVKPSRPQPEPKPGPTGKCPNCGSPIEPADKFCVGCGREVN
jgi:hypothetical protein